MKSAIFIVVLPLALAGCASTRPLPEVLTTQSPVNAKTKVAPYRPVVRGYVHRKPLSPKPWVPEDAPKPEGAGQ